MQQERELIELAKSGSRDALEMLFRQYQNKLYGFLLRMLQSPELAQDATQNTLVNAMRGLKNYTEQGQFKSWLFTIAHREGLRVLRSSSKHSDKAVEYLDQAFGSSEHPGAAYDRKQEVKLLEAAIQRLPAPEREVVLLRLREDLPFKEISKITGVRLNTVLGRMHNATKRLKKLLTQEELL